MDEATTVRQNGETTGVGTSNVTTQVTAKIDPKMAHEAAEAARKIEWEAKRAAKKAVEDKVLEEMQAMSNEDVTAAAVKVLGDDVDRITQRDMKICVTEHIQALCRVNPDFARKTMHPRKSLTNCIYYINRYAQQYLEDEMKRNGETRSGNVLGGSIPDGICYKWAEDYFNDPDAKEDKDKDDEFVPKHYYGGSSNSRAKKKDPPKPPKPVEQVDLDLDDPEEETA